MWNTRWSTKTMPPPNSRVRRNYPEQACATFVWVVHPQHPHQALKKTTMNHLQVCMQFAWLRLRVRRKFAQMQSVSHSPCFYNQQLHSGNVAYCLEPIKNGVYMCITLRHKGRTCEWNHKSIAVLARTNICPIFSLQNQCFFSRCLHRQANEWIRSSWEVFNIVLPSICCKEKIMHRIIQNVYKQYVGSNGQVIVIVTNRRPWRPHVL